MNITLINQDILRELMKFPVFSRCRPLKVGIREDLEAAGVDPVAATVALSFLTSSPAYLSQCVLDAQRYDLNGRPAGVVTREQAWWARKRLAEVMSDDEGQRAAAAFVQADPRRPQPPTGAHRNGRG